MQKLTPATDDDGEFITKESADGTKYRVAEADLSPALGPWQAEGAMNLSGEENEENTPPDKGAGKMKRKKNQRLDERKKRNRKRRERDKGASPKKDENAEEESGPTQAEVQHAAAKLRRAGAAKPGRAKSLARKLLSGGLSVDDVIANRPDAPAKEKPSAGLPTMDEPTEEDSGGGGGGADSDGSVVTRPAVKDSATMRIEAAQSLVGDYRDPNFVFRGLDRHGPEGQRLARADVMRLKREKEEARHRNRVEELTSEKRSGTTFHNL